MGNCMGENAKRQQKIQTQTFPTSNIFLKKGCRVDNCRKNHTKHYCRVCHDQDSSHFTKDCGNSGKLNKYVSIKLSLQQGCKVNGCQENHRNHFCKICLDEDSYHFASSCPKGTTVYHGTAQIFEEAIKDKGFKPSQTGRIGKGVYFTNNRDVAWQIAQQRAGKNGSNPIVFQARIPKDSIITQKAQHPTWGGVTPGPFRELKVNNEKQIRVIKILKNPNI